METRNIGSLKVTAVGLGGNNFGSRLDVERTRAVVDAALADRRRVRSPLATL